jgi:uncharacterized delta-60 repeat protein
MSEFLSRTYENLRQILSSKLRSRQRAQQQKAARHRLRQLRLKQYVFESLETRELLALTVQSTGISSSGTLPVNSTSLAIVFSEATTGGDLVSNYELRRAGADGQLGTVDDAVITINSIDTTGNTCSLAFAAIPEDLYRLTVSDEITNLSNQSLDGDATGFAGGDYVQDFIAGQRLVAWGNNGGGQLGDGTTSNHILPASVNQLTGVTSISAGWDHMLALKSDGTVWAWGYNAFGQLGDGTTVGKATPIQVSGLSNVVAIAAGDNHSLALLADGTVKAWGLNTSGAVGDGTTTNRNLPVTVPGLTNVTSIAGGRDFSLALRSDGTARSWGLNTFGSLGDGSTTTRLTPVVVTGISNATGIAAGSFHGMALISDGTVRTWGYNAIGQIGDGTTTNRLTAVTVTGLTGVASVHAGYQHSIARLNDGTVRAWGYNQYSQLGDGTTTNRFTPVTVQNLSGVTKITTGGYHSFAILQDKGVRAWGWNEIGQLGDGTTTNRSVPVVLAKLPIADLISANGASSIALRTQLSTTNVRRGTSQTDAALSAQAILLANPTAPSGVYWIDPNGGSTFDAYQVYTDMTSSGGGWTQAIRANGNSSNFAYDSSLWTTSGLLNAASPGTLSTEHKNNAYNNLPFNQLMLNLTTGNNSSNVIANSSGVSMFQVFQGDQFRATEVGQFTWLNTIPGAQLQNGYYAEGLNVKGLSPTFSQSNSRVRFGALGNQESDLGSPDSFIGIGASDFRTGVSVGNFYTANGGAPYQNIPSAGSLYARDAIAPRIVSSSITQSVINPGTGSFVVALSFSETMANKDIANNYKLVSLGADNQFGTSDDTWFPVKATTVTSYQVSLSIPPIPQGSFRLIAKSGMNGLLDTAGNSLDGDNDGIAGGNWIQNFSVNHNPSVSSINRASAIATTSSSSSSFVVTFSEPVTGVDATDFQVVTSGSTTATSTVVVSSISSTVYNVTVNGISGAGTVGVNLIDNSSIRDATNLGLVSGFRSEVEVKSTTVTDFGAVLDRALATVVQADGKLVVAGVSNNDFGLVRYNVDGTLDTSFSSDGKVTTAIGTAMDAVYAVAMYGTKIIVAGTSNNGSNEDFAIARYNSDGSLDGSFSGDGKTTITFGSGNDEAYELVVQPNGKIVAVGISSNGVDLDIAMARFNSDGSLDNQFDGDGKVITTIGSSNDVGVGVALLPDGKIVVGGHYFNGSNYDFAVVKYNSDGSLDSSFNGNGKALASFGTADDIGYAVAIQPDGKIVLGGRTATGGNDDFAALRFNSNGTLDTSFSDDGKVSIPFGSGTDIAYSVQLQSDGKVVLSGSTDTSGNLDFAAVRLSSIGTLDTSFDNDGKFVIPVGNGGDVAYASAIQSDGTIVLVGLSNNGTNDDFAVAKLAQSGQTYTVIGQVVSTSFTVGGTLTSGASSMTVTFNGPLVGIGTASNYQLQAAGSDGLLLSTDSAIVPVTVTVSGSSAILNFASPLTEDVYRLTINDPITDAFGNRLDGDSDGTPTGIWRRDFVTDARTTLLDKSFANAGTQTTDFFAGANDKIRGLAIQSDGKAIAVGENGIVVRYLTNGTLDPSFGDLGKASFFASAKSIAIQSDGKIVVVGELYDGFNSNFAVARYNTNGTPDLSFDEDGKLTTDINGLSNDYAKGVVLQPDGKIVVAGSSIKLNNYDFALVRYNSDGTLDTTFDGDGKLTADFSGENDEAQSVAIQSDGRLILVGNSSSASNTDFAIARYNPNGTLDTTFDGDGKARTAIGSSSDIAFSVASQGDGKIVVAGYAFTGSVYNFALVRYTPNGSLDSTFDGDGKLTTLVGTSSQATSLAIQSDGKIVAAGQAFVSPTNDFAVVRYNVNGSLDTTFDGDGKLTSAIGTSNDQVNVVALQSDGKIIAGGYAQNASQSSFALARYGANGTLDSSFDGDGKVTTITGLSNDIATSVAVQNDGKSVVAGYTPLTSGNFGISISRYNTDGTLDITFGDDGKISTSIDASDEAGSVAVQNDGKIVVAGSAFVGNGYDFVVVRYNTNGTLDTSFDGDGKITVSIGTSTNDRANSLVIQSDGKILVAGETNNGSRTDFALIRLNANGSLDTTFDGDGKLTTSVGVSDSVAKSITIQTDGKIVLAGHAYVTSYDFAVVRYNSNGSLDLTFDGDGRLTTDFSSSIDYATGVALQSDGKIVVGGYSFGTSYDFAAVRYTANGVLDSTFSGDGKVRNDISSSDDFSVGIAIQSDGKIVLGGTSDSGTPTSHALIRYDTSGSLDSTFGANGILKSAIGYSNDDFAAAIALQADGGIVLAGSSATLRGVYDFSLSRYEELSGLGLSTSSGRIVAFDAARSGSGQILSTSSFASDGINRLFVFGVDFAPPSGAAGNLTDNGHTFVSPVDSLNGVDFYRENTVPSTGSQDFVRTIEVVTASVGGGFTVPIRMVGNLGSDLATSVFATSDGDTIVEPTDWWFGTDDGDGVGTPAVIHLFRGPRGMLPASISVTEDNVDWTFNLTVGPGETKRLATFTILGNTRAEAIAAANALVTTNGFGGQAAAFLTQTELDSLVNFANYAPTDFTVSSNSIAENNLANAVIGTFTSIDANPFEDFTYLLVPGTGDTDNSAFTITGNQLKANTPFNYETKNNYSIRVRTTDLGGLSFEKTFTINVTDVDEIAPTVSTTSFVSSGTLDAGTTSLTVTFSEPVVGASVTSNYELRRAGADGLLGNADDPITAIDSATVANGTNIAMLSFSGLTEDVYRLTLKDLVTDASGNPLDGDNNGTTSGDWRKDFVVGALRTSLTSSNGFDFDPEFGGAGAGQLVHGTNNAFDGLGRLIVNGTGYSANLNPRLNVSNLTITPATGLIGSAFTQIGSLTTSITTRSDSVVRLSSVVNLYEYNTPEWGNVQARFVVDGMPLGLAQTLLTPPVNGTSPAWQFPVEDYITLTPGPHVVGLELRQIADPAVGGSPSSFPLYLDDFSQASISAVEFSPSSVSVLNEVTTNVSQIQVPGSFASISGLATTFTSTMNSVLRTSASVNLYALAGSGWSNVQFRFVLDGVAQPAAKSILVPPISNNATPESFFVALEDYLQASAGSHVLQVEFRQINDPGAGGGASAFPIFIDDGAASTLRVFGLGSTQDLGIVETTSIPVQSQISSSFAPIVTSQGPNLTTVATVASNPVRLTAAFSLYGIGAPWANISARFVVDGVPLTSSQIILFSNSSNLSTVNAEVESLVTLSAGVHTIGLQLMQSQIPEYGGLPSSYQILIDDGAGITVRAAEIRSLPQLADNGRTILMGREILPNVTVNRSISVPDSAAASFSRAVETVSNNGTSILTIPIRTVGNLGSDAATTIFASSDGDNVVEPTDWWIGTDDGDGVGTPAVIHLFRGPRGMLPTTISVTEDNVDWTYNLTVGPGETKRLATFTIIGNTRAEAIAAANALVTTNGFGGQAAAFLTQTELDSLVNFANYAPTDFTVSSNSIAENNLANAVIGTFTSIDANPFEDFTYLLVPGTGDTDNSAFTITGNQLKANTPFNYETKNNYSIRVRTTDLGGLSFEKTFTINVTDVDEIAPTVSTTSFVSSGTLDAGTTSLTVTFSEPVVGANIASNYQLQKSGSDGLLLNTNSTITPTSVVLTGNTATLNFGTPFVEDVYRLTVSDQITDVSGNRLKGEGDGIATGNWRRDFLVNISGGTSFGDGGIATTNFFNNKTSSDRAKQVVIQADGKIVSVGNNSIVRHLTSGELDISFGTGGNVLFAGEIRSVAIQGNGKIVVAGASFNGSNYDFALARINPNGSFDSSFDGDGKLTTAIGDSSAFAQSVAIQSDGKIVVAGYCNYPSTDFALARYNPDGSLDTTFDEDGKLTTAFGSTTDEATSVAIQSDGKIVVAGSSYNGGKYEFALARYNVNGALDTLFDGDGKLTTNIGNLFDVANSVAIQSDSKILVAGYSHNGSDFDFALTRYNTNGSLDATFDIDGKLTSGIGMSTDIANNVAIQIDNKIVVGGYSFNGSDNDFALTRYNENGSLDTTFDGDGKLTTAIGTSFDEGNSVAFQNDGKILVAGYSRNGNDDFALARYNTNGSLDTTFDGDGKLITEIGTSQDYANGVAIQSDGKIVVAGQSYNGSNYDFALVRYNTNGSLDSTFDGDGKLTTAIGLADDHAYSIAIQSDGKVVVAGQSYNGSNYDFALTRYNTNGSLDTDFDEDGKLTTSIGNSHDQAFSVALQSDGKIVVAGTSYNGSDYDFALTRYNANGSLDTTFDDDGLLITTIGNSTDLASSVAIQSDGKIVAAGWSINGGKSEFALTRYNANGTLDTTFHEDGKLTTAFGTSDGHAFSIAIQSDGKIVAGGGSYNGASTNFALARYSSDGSLDTTFDQDGRLTTAIGTFSDQARSVAIQSDGKIVAAGNSYNGIHNKFVLARYNANGSLDTSFDEDGLLVTVIGLVDGHANSVAIQSDGQIVVAGSSNNEVDSDFVVFQFNPQKAVVSLNSPNGLVLNFDTIGVGTGQLIQGPANAFDGYNRLMVNGTGIGANAAPTMVDGGRTIVTPSTSISGLTVSREINVPIVGSQDFARDVDTFTNSTADAISATVRTVGNLGSDTATTVFATSDGDNIVEQTDWWFGTDDGDGTGTPAIVHLIRGKHGLTPASVAVTEDNVDWTYNLTVAPGETMRLATFTILGNTRAEAIAAVNALINANGFGGEAASFLTMTELASLANFQFNQSPTNVSLTPASISENQSIGTTVGKLTTTDPNAGDTFMYSLVTGTGDADNGRFSIVGNSLRSNAVFDFETTNSFSIRIRTTDQDGLSIDKAIVVQVTNVNELPATSDRSKTILEDSLLTLVANDFNFVDPDVGNSLQSVQIATLPSVGTLFVDLNDNSAFDGGLETLSDGSDVSIANINSSRLIFRPVAQANGTPYSSFDFRVSDGALLSGKSTMSIAVTPVNDAPSFMVGANQTVLEDAGPQTVSSVSTPSKVYWVNNTAKTIQRSNLDGTNVESVHTITIPGHDFSDIEVDLQAGKIYWSESYAFRRANLDGTNVETLINQLVTPALKVPLFFKLDTANGKVFFPSTTPSVNAPRFVYRMNLDGSNQTPLFEANTGSITYARIIDLAIDSTNSKIYWTTSNGYDSIGRANIDGSDMQILIPDSAPGFSYRQIRLDVSAGKLYWSANDFTRSIQRSNLDGTGQETIHASLGLALGFDLDTTAGKIYWVNGENSNSAMEGSVQRSNLNGTNLETLVADLNITSFIDLPSLSLALTGTSGQTGWATAISAGPMDESSQTLTFLVTGNTNPALFSIPPSVSPQGILTYTPAPNANGSATITLSLTDNGGTANGGQNSSASQAFLVTVTPINDAPTSLNLSSLSIAENNAANAVVGSFSSFDPDFGDTFTYSRVTGFGDTDNGAFTIVGDQLRANASFDFETKNSYRIRVRTTDAGGLTFEQALNLLVTDVNEAPRVELDNIISVLAENANSAARVKVADVRVIDDALGAESLSIIGADAAKFEIDNSVLYVRAGVSLDFESQINYSIQIQVDDTTLGTTPEDTVGYSLSLTDVNEFAVTQPVDTDSNVDGISETAPVGSIIGITVHATDNDGSNNTVTYALVDSANGRFAIHPTTGVVTLAIANLDHETTPMLSILVRATSSDGSTADQLFGFVIANVDEPVVLVANQANVTGDVLSTFSNSGTWFDPENANVTLNVTQGPGTVSKHANGTWTWSHTPTTKLDNATVTITASDGLLTSSVSFTVNALVALTNRKIYYKDSDYANLLGVDGALDTNKSFLTSSTVPQTTTEANKINYSRGINGVVIDVAGLVGTNLTTSDIVFRVSPTGAQGVVNPSQWANAPAPSNMFVTPGSGATPARIRIEWADIDAVKNGWLQIIVKPTANTGLNRQSAFYIGHAMAEITGGTPYRVTAADLSAVQSGISNTIVSVSDPRDINKDRRVTAVDLSAVQSRIANTVLLNDITIPIAGSSEEG